MRIRRTGPAAEDLYRITRYIRRDNPEAARKVAKTIYDGCTSLAFSEPGTHGNGTRHARARFFPLPISRFTA